MESEEVRPAEAIVDRQILVLLQHHRRLTFRALADSLPAHSWRSLFVALNRLCHQQHVELMPLAGDYEVVWRHWRDEPPRSEEPCIRT
ncbi:MAG: hypothetical protein R3B37_08690 [Nitrospira sp.]|nr:hypothetical protein [Nitrospira sp.]